MRQRLARLVTSAPLPALALALVGLAATAAHAEEPAALPDALPPLDDAVVGETPPVQVFAEARMRAALDAARELTRNDTAAAVGLGGRAGVITQLDFGRIAVGFGEAGALGMAGADTPLVQRPPVHLLQRAELVLEGSLVGVPAEVSLGRAPLAIGDGRLFGAEPFDLYGRSFDGGRAQLHGDIVDVGVGAWWLGGVGEALDVAAAVDGALTAGEAIDLDAWMVAESAGAVGLLVPTVGARVRAALWSLQGRAAAELQGPLAAASLDGAGLAGRITAGGRATLDEGALGVPLPRAFVDVDTEVVAGAVVAGRVLRAPAPTLHGTRGALDLLAPDNTWKAALALGLVEERLTSTLTGMVVGVVDRAGPLVDPRGAPVVARRQGGGGVALWELDLELRAELSADLALGVTWGVAAPGAALVGEVPAQRLLVELCAKTNGW